MHAQALNQEPEVEAAVLAATEEYALQEGPDGALLPNAQSLHNVFGLVLVSYVNVCEEGLKGQVLGWGRLVLPDVVVVVVVGVCWWAILWYWCGGGMVSPTVVVLGHCSVDRADRGLLADVYPTHDAANKHRPR